MSEIGPAGERADLFDVAGLLGKLGLRPGAHAGMGRGVLAVEGLVLLQGFRNGLGMGQVRLLVADLVGRGIDPGLSAHPRPSCVGGNLGAKVPGFRREALGAVLRDLAEVRADLGWHVAHINEPYIIINHFYTKCFCISDHSLAFPGDPLDEWGAPKRSGRKDKPR